MEIHEIEEVFDEPFFRRMKIKNGWLYNFYDSKGDVYSQEWTFVPDDHKIDIGKKKEVIETLAMLNSMVNSGEYHSEQSKEMYVRAISILSEI